MLECSESARRARGSNKNAILGIEAVNLSDGMARVNPVQSTVRLASQYGSSIILACFLAFRTY